MTANGFYGGQTAMMQSHRPFFSSSPSVDYIHHGVFNRQPTPPPEFCLKQQSTPLPQPVMEVESLMAPPAISLFGEPPSGGDSIPSEFTARPNLKFGEHLSNTSKSDGSPSVVVDDDIDEVLKTNSDDVEKNQSASVNTQDVIMKEVDQEIENLVDDLLNDAEGLDKSLPPSSGSESTNVLLRPSEVVEASEDLKPTFRLTLRKDLLRSDALDFKSQSNVISNACDTDDQSEQTVITIDEPENTDTTNVLAEEPRDPELARMDELLRAADMMQCTAQVHPNPRESLSSRTLPPTMPVQSLMNPPPNVILPQSLSTPRPLNQSLPNDRRSSIVDQYLSKYHTMMGSHTNIRPHLYHPPNSSNQQFSTQTPTPRTYSRLGSSVPTQLKFQNPQTTTSFNQNSFQPSRQIGEAPPNVSLSYRPPIQSQGNGKYNLLSQSLYLPETVAGLYDSIGNSSSVGPTEKIKPDKKRYVPRPGKVPLYDDPTLPEGWSRRVSQRMSGATAGSYDVYITDPEGRRFRSKLEIRRHFEKICETRWNWQDFDFNPFGSKGQQEMKSVAVST
jgi:hypothetical protein